MKRRKFSWLYSLDKFIILGLFEPKNMELHVSTCQASVLLIFNSSDRLSFSDIKTKLNLTHDDAVQLNMSTPVFFLGRIQVGVPCLSMDEKQKKKVIKTVEQDWRCAIQTSIAYIMRTINFRPPTASDGIC
ncbi:putative cullin [Dioscorea sansibarensis]